MYLSPWLHVLLPESGTINGLNEASCFAEKLSEEIVSAQGETIHHSSLRRQEEPGRVQPGQIGIEISISETFLRKCKSHSSLISTCSQLYFDLQF